MAKTSTEVIQKDVTIVGRLTVTEGLESSTITQLQTKVGETLVTSEVMAGDIADRPTYAEVAVSGFTEGGGTATPSKPVISAVKSIYKTITVQWNAQPLLTNFDRYEVRANLDGGATWFALAFDGSTGAGGPGLGAEGYTAWYGETLVHTLIPFAGTTAAPTSRTVYYQVRRVTKASAASAWSDTVSGANVPPGEGDLAADSVTADKVKTGTLNALIAEIQNYLAIGDTDSSTGCAGIIAGNFTGAVTGCQRTWIDQNELRLQYGCGTNAWATAIRLGGCADGVNCYTAYFRDWVGIGVECPTSQLHVKDTLTACWLTVCSWLNVGQGGGATFKGGCCGIGTGLCHADSWIQEIGDKLWLAAGCGVVHWTDWVGIGSCANCATLFVTGPGQRKTLYICQTVGGMQMGGSPTVCIYSEATGSASNDNILAIGSSSAAVILAARLNGNLGIKCSCPAESLDVCGNIKVSGCICGAAAYLAACGMFSTCVCSPILCASAIKVVSGYSWSCGILLTRDATCGWFQMLVNDVGQTLLRAGGCCAAGIAFMDNDANVIGTIGNDGATIHCVCVQSPKLYTSVLCTTSGGHASPSTNICFGSGADDSDSYIKAGATADVWSAVRIAGNWNGSSRTGGLVAFYTAGTERLTVTCNGFIGFGTGGPRGTVEINLPYATYCTQLRIGGCNGGCTTAGEGGETHRNQIVFSSFRDAVPDTIGAKIAAVNLGCYINPNYYYVQYTELRFYTLGQTASTCDDTVERLRICANGNIHVTTAAAELRSPVMCATTCFRTDKAVLIQKNGSDSQGEGPMMYWQTTSGTISAWQMQIGAAGCLDVWSYCTGCNWTKQFKFGHVGVFWANGCVQSPVLCATSCVLSGYLKAGTCICSDGLVYAAGAVCGATCVAGPFVCATTAVLSDRYHGAGGNIAICGLAVCEGVCGSATCCSGVRGEAVTCLGVLGVAPIYGVYGSSSSCFPVGGNGAYHDSTSMRRMKVDLGPGCVLCRIRSNPTFEVHEWMWDDSNQRGFDRFIAPFSEDVEATFQLTFGDDGYYQLDGIALGGVVELTREIDVLRARLETLEAKLGDTAA